VTLTAAPLFFEPIYKKTLWGGTALGSRFNRPIPDGQQVGESWDIVSHAADQSRLSTGPLAGASLAELAANYRDALLGKTPSSGSFPLLCKFIDANDRLSVQVHPDDRNARLNGWGEFGKTECWYILDAQPGAEIILGWNRDVSREEISRRIENGSLPEVLNRIPIQKGDLLFVPAGTVHAIMEGTLIYEMQETSDTTLRLFDWDRVDAAGARRPLQVRDALTVLDMKAHSGYRINPVVLDEGGSSRAVRIAIEEYTFGSQRDFILRARHSFRIVTVVAGTLELRYPGGNAAIRAGGTVLLPALLRDVQARGSAGCIALVTSVPDLQAEIINPLRRAGIDDAAIAGLGGSIPERNDLLARLDPAGRKPAALKD
jgi:mannose-6-phosphate isomerase